MIQAQKSWCGPHRVIKNTKFSWGVGKQTDTCLDVFASLLF